MNTDDNRLTFNFYITLAIILIEGFVTISIEMITIRQLITVVGNSIIITSLIIGVFLLFLALGYYRGGLHQQHYRRVLIRNFTLSSLLLGIGLSYVFIQSFFYFIFSLITNNALIALIFYLLLITAPLIYFLGQTVPISTNLFRLDKHIGAISGKVLCISTMGSFLGSILTTLVLMNFFGVALTIFVNFFLLLLLITLLIIWKESVGRLFALLLVTVLVFWINIKIEQQLFVKTNNYGDYQVVRNTYFPPLHGAVLNINNAPSSFLTADKKGFEYIEMIKKILFQDLHYTNKEILVLGAGGFSLSAETTHGNRFTYVDIDGDLPKIANTGFIQHINGQFIADDARKFLLHTNSHFDAVISDEYSGHYTIPFHLLTKEYFQTIQKILKPNGVAIFNVIANPMMQDAYSKRVDNTIRSVFKNCAMVPIPFSDQPANLIYVCTARPNNDTAIYTDNKNGSMIDIFYNQ